MKKRVFFLLLFSIIFIGMCNEVNALEKIATCSYSVKDVQDFEVEIYNNKIEHPDNDLVPGKSIMFMYSFKEKEYLNKVYDGNKLAAQCPTLAYCTDASGNYIIQAENTICAAGGDSTSISGTMKIEKNDVEVKEEITYVSREKLSNQMVSPIRTKLIDERNRINQYADEETENIKDFFEGKFDEVDKILTEKAKELRQAISSKEESQKALKGATELLERLTEIKKELDAILEI